MASMGYGFANNPVSQQLLQGIQQQYGQQGFGAFPNFGAGPGMTGIMPVMNGGPQGPTGIMPVMGGSPAPQSGGKGLGNTQPRQNTQMFHAA